MRKLVRWVLALWAVPLVLASAAQAQVKLRDGTVLPEKPFYIVTYVEAAPAAAAQAAALLRKQSADSKREKGNLRFEALQRVGQKNHFVLLEAWADKDARNAHAKAAHTVAFRKALQPLLYNPYDERPHAGLVHGDSAKLAKGTAAMIYVVTHVDIIPPEQFPPCKRQVDEKGPCGNKLVEQLAAASRKHKGNLRFDALTQTNRPNHMTVVEMWASDKDQEAHQVTADVKGFRDGLFAVVPGSGVAADPLFLPNPLSGSLYDERLYKLID
jgi:quinol monooxygenase YgiN